MEFFVILVNGWKLLSNVTKNFILDVAGVVDTPLSFDIKVSTKTNETVKMTISSLSYSLTC